MTVKKDAKIGSLNREIVRMTLPTVLSNVSVPLLGLCDTAVAGHMAGEKYLAGIAIGSVMVTTLYWLFGFLRAGTSGLTANAYGASDKVKMGSVLIRSVMIGILIGIVIMVIHAPVLAILEKAMGASEEVRSLSGRYFSICILGSVPMMVLTALTGWLVGMQSTAKAMTVNIGLSLINVVATLTFVYGFGLGFEGIAYGTLAAQWLILIPAVWIVVSLCRRKGVVLRISRSILFEKEDWQKMVSVNSNLFFRSACLIALTMMLYAYSARIGDVEVSSNAVINQMFLFFSYFMDGFAFTGEALVGKYCGSGDVLMLRMSIAALLRWTAGITIVFILAYGAGLSLIVKLLSDSEAVWRSTMECRVWVMALPLAGGFAFIYDGFYIGLTRTRPMLISTVCGVALFALLLHVSIHSQWMLWMAFACYLALRSGLLICMFKVKDQRLES